MNKREQTIPIHVDKETHRKVKQLSALTGNKMYEIMEYAIKMTYYRKEFEQALAKGDK